jgi:asparagine synthase (glutamine-hydrolysing)
VRNLPDPVQRGLRSLAALVPEGVKGKSYLQRATTPIEVRYFGNARVFDDVEAARLVHATPNGPVHSRVTAALYAEAGDLDDVATMQHVDVNTWLPGDILAKADRMSMAHSLELRVPYLDRAVFEVAARIPASLKVPRHSRATKVVLRRALRGIVPEFVVNRPKLGFPTPTREWLRGPLYEWAHDVLSTSGAGGLVDLDYAHGLLTAHRDGSADNARKLWILLSFCLWHAVFVEGSIKPVVSRTGLQPPVATVSGKEVPTIDAAGRRPRTQAGTRQGATVQAE